MFCNFMGEHLECIGVHDESLKQRSDVVKRRILPVTIGITALAVLARIARKLF
jgi:hypothetical protein